MKYFLLFALLLSPTHASLHAQDQAIVWQETIGAFDSDFLWNFNPTSDGGYILAAESFSGATGDKTEPNQGMVDYWAIKLDATGGIEWQNTIGGSSGDRLLYALETSDNGYFLAGYSSSPISGDKTEDAINGSIDYWVLKLDNSGSIVWQNTIGGDGFDLLFSAEQTSDGGFVLAGYSASGISGDKTEPLMGERDYWVVKLDNLGVIEWEKTVGGDGADWLRDIKQTSDNGYILAGYSNSNISGDKTENAIGETDYWVVKLDSSGVVQWDNTIGGSGSDDLWGVSLTTDGGYILNGNSNSNISGDKTENSEGGVDNWIIKLDSTGAIQWQNTIGGSDNDWTRFVAPSNDGGYLLASFSYSNSSGDKDEDAKGGSDYWVVKLAANGTIVSQNTIGGSADEFIYSVFETPSGEVILGGSSNSGISGDKTEALIGVTDLWFVQLDALLNIPTNNFTTILEVFPNPVATTLTIVQENNQALVVDIFSLNGQKVAAYSLSDSVEKIDLSHLSSGTYLLYSEIDGKTITRRFVKE